ncbi:MAG: DUF4258 domain-containing protein [Nitrospira sp. LK70]|nr:DUF4258 domain-containing protein [Nitrospira sp. LK70]
MKPIAVTSHARKRMHQRGAREEDVVKAIQIGEREAAQRGLILYRLNLEFHREWDGRYYRMQQVAPVVAEEPDRIVVITVYTFYFQEGGKP